MESFSIRSCLFLYRKCSWNSSGSISGYESLSGRRGTHPIIIASITEMPKFSCIAVLITTAPLLSHFSYSSLKGTYPRLSLQSGISSSTSVIRAHFKQGAPYLTGISLVIRYPFGPWSASMWIISFMMNRP